MIKSSKKGSDGSKYRINDQIDQDEVRLIAEDGEQVGIVSFTEAMAVAGEAALDLVEIAADAEPPVCRIMDYGKHQFEEKKKRAGARKRQKQVQLKEMKFRPNTEEGDYKVKLKNLIRFLEDGDKAKVTMRFRGREMAHQDIGERLIGRVRDDLEAYGTVEQEPKFEGRQIVMVLGPKKRG